VLAEAGLREEAGAIADEALAEAGGPGTVASFWIADLAEALQELGRVDALSEPLLGGRIPTRWLVAALRLDAGAYAEAADQYGAMGARPEEARARLRASAALAATGDRSTAQEQLERALSFYREVGADAYARAAESLVVAGA
jgi:tetratricopeptide (TPR) repeat protein